MSLGRKQRISNEAWLDAVATIESAVSRSQMKELTAATVEDIRATVEGKRAAYAWSAGKDSIVLGHICEAAGVTDSMIGVCDLEYPAFAAWVQDNKPAGCEVINTHQDLDWLTKHPEMLFPQESATAGRWFSIVQHRAQREYFKAHQLDTIILGRRRADGNFVGRGTNTYTDGKGVTRFSPLAAWSHEHVLAYIHYNKLPLPPIYGWKNGYLCGTHPRPARQWTGSIENGWREVYDIDPSIVTAAAEKIESAQAFIEGGAGMKVTKKLLTELHPPERNVRMHTGKQLKEFRRSVEMFGQIRPIVVDEGGTILAGNGLYETLRAMGRAEADCYIVTGLTEAQKKKLMLADNRVFDLGVDDLAALDALVLELKDDLDIPGFEEDLLRAMVMEADEASAALSEYGTIDQDRVEEIRETGQRYEAREVAAAERAVECTPQTTGGQPQQAEQTSRFVLCPKCGERIWL